MERGEERMVQRTGKRMLHTKMCHNMTVCEREKGAHTACVGVDVGVGCSSDYDMVYCAYMTSSI
jgi:hypothetical protein